MNNEHNGIELTLAPDMEVPEPQQTAPQTQISPVEAASAHPLTEAEQAMVHEFAQKIDVTNSTQILQYGNAAQKKISDFSESAKKSPISQRARSPMCAQRTWTKSAKCSRGLSRSCAASRRKASRRA